ncbi:MAG TPA: hypothetical protein VHK27_09245 [Gammaproteobacteria bacterium]|nr:hypothetical protein [Gammaproteobacteria bacterium]
MIIDHYRRSDCSPERGRIAAALDRVETALSDRDVQAALRQRVEMIDTQ